MLNSWKEYHFVCQVPHLQIMGLQEKEQMFTMGDQYLAMGEDINIRGLQIIRFEFFYLTVLFASFHVLQMCHYDIKLLFGVTPAPPRSLVRKTSMEYFITLYRISTLASNFKSTSLLYGVPVSFTLVSYKTNLSLTTHRKSHFD